jgi:hypothetical protein
MPTKEELEATIRETQMQLEAIEADERAAEGVKLIGNCYESRLTARIGSIGDGELRIFRRMMGVRGAEWVCFEFSTDENGVMIMNPEAIRQPSERALGKQISPAAFLQKLLLFTESIRAQSQAIANL